MVLKFRVNGFPSRNPTVTQSYTPTPWTMNLYTQAPPASFELRLRGLKALYVQSPRLRCSGASAYHERKAA